MKRLGSSPLTVRQVCVAIFGVALLARVAFWVLLAPKLLGPHVYFNHDSASYTGFINLWQTGLYTFDPLHPDARFGRVPVYPFFWGAHWLVFGDAARYAVAVSQTLIDSFTAVLLGGIAWRVTRRVAVMAVTGALYAAYPFAILWVTVTGTEVVTTFLGAAILFGLFSVRRERDWLFVGAAVGLATLTREYLAAMGLVCALYAASRSATWTIAAKRGTLLAVGFALVFSVWPLRNFVVQQEPVLLRPITSGYHRYSPDIVAARSWIGTWTNEADAYLDWLSGKTDEVSFPDVAFTDATQRARLEQLRARGLECSTGVYFWRTNQVRSWEDNCNEELTIGYEELRAAHRHDEPVRYFVDVPARNLAKCFFKNDTVGGANLALRAGLMYRTLLLLLGVLGAVCLRRRAESAALHTTFALHYLLLCVGMRFVEMRYLVWVDSLMLVPAGYVIVMAIEHVRNRKHGTQRI